MIATIPKTKSSKKHVGIKVQSIMHKVNPNLILTDDAVELLNAVLTEKFTLIAEAASKIVEKGKQEHLGCNEIKQAVSKVFNSNFWRVWY